jgi:uncharacterized protein (TIGR00296 family)
MNADDAYGAGLLRLARDAVDAETSGKKFEIPDSPAVPAGVFVTVSEYPSGNLRGCIGIPEPVYPMNEALAKAGASACHDPRFPPLTYGEASECTVEITILTPPEELEFENPEEMKNGIVLGRDGIILEYGGRRALFLPQVAPEWGWTKEETLEHLSEKAGLRRNDWKRPGVRIWTFRGEIFSEETPRGKTIRK